MRTLYATVPEAKHKTTYETAVARVMRDPESMRFKDMYITRLADGTETQCGQVSARNGYGATPDSWPSARPSTLRRRGGPRRPCCRPSTPGWTRSARYEWHSPTQVIHSDSGQEVTALNRSIRRLEARSDVRRIGAGARDRSPDHCANVRPAMMLAQ